jgi:vacuolar-type H+-ATPase catalytic subunit A/Vma1
MMLTKSYSPGLPLWSVVLTGRDLAIGLGPLFFTGVAVGIICTTLDLLRAARKRYLKRGSGHQFLSGNAKSHDRSMAADLERG